MSKRQQQGFTLIELVVVIVILGILAAFAVPRFMGLETEARVSAVKSLGGAMRSAAAMAHGNCMAQNCPNASTVVSVNGTNVTFLNQYPNNASIQLLMESANGFTINAAGNRFTKQGARVPANCWVQYNQSTGSGLAPQIQFYNIGAAANGYMGVSAAQDAAIEAAMRTNC